MRNSFDDLREQLLHATSTKYRVLAELGRGGMAVVFLAEDLDLGRRVAIKALLPDCASDHETVTRFRRESRVAASLEHPAIVAVYDVGDDSAMPYFVMQHVPGQSLAQLLTQRGALDYRDVTKVVGIIGRALYYAHRRDVVHRDVKPANLLRSDEGRVYVADFGIAKRKQLDGLTKSGVVFGTLEYMSPEQLDGAPATAASDQYAMGMVSYELLTGHLPFDPARISDVFRWHLEEPPPPLMTRGRKPPDALQDVIHRMLAKNPADRFADMRECARAFEAAASGLPVDEDASARVPVEDLRVLVSSDRGAPARRRSRWPWAVAAFAVLLALALRLLSVRAG